MKAGLSKPKQVAEVSEVRRGSKALEGGEN